LKIEKKKDGGEMKKGKRDMRGNKRHIRTLR